MEAPGGSTPFPAPRHSVPVFDPNLPDNGRPSHPNDETVLVAPAPLQGDTHGSDTRANREAARGQIALVEGSSPHLSQVTRDVLRNRLRTVAVLLFIGFTAFLARWPFYWDEWGKPEFRP